MALDPNNDTERVVEVPWLLANVGFPAAVLDVGGAGSPYLDELEERAGVLDVIDTRESDDPRVFYEDVTRLPDAWTNYYDAITCISVLDHVGLTAYGNEADPLALEKAVAEMWRVLEPDGRLFVTVPVGAPQVTTHPGGEQRVFDINEFRALFPDDLWQWERPFFWRLVDGQYLPCGAGAAMLAGYAGYRAEAVMCVVLTKVADDV